MMRARKSLLGPTGAMLALLAGPANAVQTYDIVVYGGTSSAVIAAVQAKKMGKSVVIVSPDTHHGGLSSGGLGIRVEGAERVERARQVFTTHGQATIRSSS